MDGLLGHKSFDSSRPSLKSRLLEVIFSTRLVDSPKFVDSDMTHLPPNYCHDRRFVRLLRVIEALSFVILFKHRSSPCSFVRLAGELTGLECLLTRSF